MIWKNYFEQTSASADVEVKNPHPHPRMRKITNIVGLDINSPKYPKCEAGDKNSITHLAPPNSWIAGPAKQKPLKIINRVSQ